MRWIEILEQRHVAAAQGGTSAHKPCPSRSAIGTEACRVFAQKRPISTITTSHHVAWSVAKKDKRRIRVLSRIRYPAQNKVKLI